MKKTGMSLQADKKRLHGEFENLKRECSEVQKLMSSVRQAVYESSAKILFWWMDASRVSGLVEGLTGHLTSYKHNAVNHGINFSPLLVVLFNNTLSDQERNRASRLLNALYNEVQANPEVYVYDRVKKLAGFIKKSGGVVAVVNTTYKNGELGKGEGTLEERAEKYEQEQAEEFAKINEELAGHGINYVVMPRSKELKAKPINEVEKVKSLTKAADDYWAKVSVDNIVNFSSAISMTEDGYSSVLVKRQGDHLVFVDANDDPKQVDAGRVAAYRKQYQALPYSLRILCEPLRTQLAPWNMATSSEILEINPDPELECEEKIARTRLMYMSKSKQFVLSPARMSTGVVTMIKPVKDVMEGVKHDVAMAPFSTTLAEVRLLGTGDFNLYDTESKEVIPVAADGKFIYSHLLNVNSKVKGLQDFCLLFKTFSDQTAGKSCQPVYTSEYDKNLSLQVELPMNAIYEITRDFATPWTNDLGTKIARSKYNHIGIKFAGAYMVISSDYEDGKFGKHKTIAYADDASTDELYSSNFLTKDIMPVLVGLGNLPIEGSVMVKADANVLTFSFKTSAASYLVAVPAFDVEKKERMTAAFKSYQPTVRKLTAEEQEELFLHQLTTTNVVDDYSDAGEIVQDEDTNLWRI